VCVCVCVCVDSCMCHATEDNLARANSRRSVPTEAPHLFAQDVATLQQHWGVVVRGLLARDGADKHRVKLELRPELYLDWQRASLPCQGFAY